MESATLGKPDWIEKTVKTILSYKEDGEATGTPEQMIDEAGNKAFKIGTALGLIPGPLGIAAILPEIAVLTRLQIGLIHRIAGRYRKQEQRQQRARAPYSRECTWGGRRRGAYEESGIGARRKIGEHEGRQGHCAKNRRRPDRHGGGKGDGPLAADDHRAFIRLFLAVYYQADREGGNKAFVPGNMLGAGAERAAPDRPRGAAACGVRPNA